MFDEFEDSFDDDEGFSVRDVDGLAEPNKSDICIGHQNIEKKLLELYQDGRLPHGFIFSGLRGIGKATFAYRFMRFLLKHGLANGDDGGLFGDDPLPIENMDVPADDPIFSKVAAFSHPDMMVVQRVFDEQKSRLKKSVEIESIRKISPFLRMTSSEGGWRVVLIDDANTMNRASQNALLKILEEPPKNTVIILITHVLGHLIPTIRSRCQVFDFNTLDGPSISTLLQRMDPSLTEASRDLLIEISDGSMGKTYRMHNEGGMEAMGSILSALETYPQMNWDYIYEIVDRYSFAGQDEAYQNFQYCFLWLMQKMINAKARASSDIGLSIENQGVNSFFLSKNLKNLLQIFDDCKQHFESADNAFIDRRQILLGLFFILNGKTSVN